MLAVIAFAPKDGTGDEKTYKVIDINKGDYPGVAKVIPRSKAAVHSEAHLTIATKHLDLPNQDPSLFAGRLNLLGLKDRDLVLLGALGQVAHQFNLTSAGIGEAEPVATLTAGYDKQSGQRFGDPHAVVNPYSRSLQVCGFISVSHEIARQHPDVLNGLRAVQPVPAVVAIQNLLLDEFSTRS